MRLILTLTVMFLVGCSTMPQISQNNAVSTSQAIPSGTLPVFPTPQASISQCIRGKVDEVIAGNSATVIWYQSTNGNGLTNVRLPMNHPVRIRLSSDGFCFDYFNVTQ